MTQHPADLKEYLNNYTEWLRGKTYSPKKVHKHVLHARAFLMKQQPVEDQEFAEFIEIPENGIIENFRNYWSVHKGKRVLPLTKKEKGLVQAAAARMGDTTSLRLRNSALISLLLDPLPISIRVSNLIWLSFNNLYRDDNHGGLEKFSEWPVLEIDPKFKISGINANTRTGKRLVRLSTNATEHLSRYVMYPEGWQFIKAYWSSYLFTPIGLNSSMVGKKMEPISRQVVWNLSRQVGEAADIKGVLYPTIMKQEPVWDESDA